MSVISGPPLEQKFHKCLSGVFQQLPADRDIASVIKAKACSVKINGMLQIDHNAPVTLIETCVHFQGGYEGIKGLAGGQFPFTGSVNVDHMGKMFRIDYFTERESEYYFRLLLHLCISRNPGCGKGFHLPVRKYHFHCRALQDSAEPGPGIPLMHGR